MGKPGAPEGNQNARNAKLWQQAIKRALARASGENVDKGLDKGADALVRSFIAGEQWAIKELGDRIDGKPAQAIVGEEENPLRVIQRIERVIVDPK